MQIWTLKIVFFFLKKRMCFHYIEVIAFRVKHFVGGIVFHKNQISSYPLCRVESSQEVKFSQVKSVFHTMLYLYSTVHI